MQYTILGPFGGGVRIGTRYHRRVERGLCRSVAQRANRNRTQPALRKIKARDHFIDSLISAKLFLCILLKQGQGSGTPS